MDSEALREFCLSLPHVTEDIQWENDLLFRIGAKIFAIMGLAPAESSVFSFKCTPEKYTELIEREGIIPAPYVARYHWVALQRLDALGDRELKNLIEGSYQMVFAKLPKRVKDQLEIKPRKRR